MRRSGTGSGGGYGSRNVVDKPVRTGAGAKAAHLGGVSQLGNKVGDHLTNKSSTNYRGDPLYAGPGYNPVKYGNELATNVGAGGPGKGRTLYGQSVVRKGAMANLRRGIHLRSAATFFGNSARTSLASEGANKMTETKYDRSHPAGATPEQRIASRLKNSGNPRADHVVQKGSGPTRTFTNIHEHGTSGKENPVYRPEPGITGKPRGVV
jgi:hypothetical protein